VTNRIFFNLLAAFLAVIAATVLGSAFFLRPALDTSLRQEVERNLKQKTLMFAHRVNTDRQYNLQDIVSQEGQAAGARATMIDVSGKVLADSEVAAKSMENSTHDPEFVAAMRGKVGVEVRRHGTFGIPVLYVASPVEGGAVRLAYPLSDPEADTSPLWKAMLAGSALAILLATILAWKTTQSTRKRVARIVQFSRQLARGQLNARIAASSRDDIGEVASSLDHTAQQLESNFVALEEKQHQLETLLNSMQEAVIAIGPDELVQWANQSMERLVFLRIRLNVPLVETVRDPDFLRAVREASETRKPVNARATSILPGHAFDVTAAPLPGGGAVVVLRDLTETERVEKTRRDFIANVSHELRTPLTSIQGYAETLLDSSATQNHSRDFLEIIRKNAARMSRLTEDLLTLARVESGEQRFDIRPVSTTELVEEAAQNFREPARVHGVEIKSDSGFSAQVDADPEAIQQVFSNLIENALKYAASGKIVELGARSIENGVEFHVRDFGPGISSEHLPRLFERFYRVDRARSRESGGTGLGLAIAKHVVFAHGGTIRAESELNYGSTFLFTLPLATVVSVPSR
jgi:two-component system, OmpR family, phosphate regulon sensor histidine kinase PhoR